MCWKCESDRVDGYASKHQIPLCNDCWQAVFKMTQEEFEEMVAEYEQERRNK